MDIVLIPGALATPKFWHHQEAHWHGEKHIHHATSFLGQSIPDVAEQLIEILPKKFTLIGFSLGGYIALELIQRIPHQVDKLILINSGAKALSEKGQIERERSIELINNGKFDFLINLIFKNSVHDKNKHLVFVQKLIVLRNNLIAPKIFQIFPFRCSFAVESVITSLICIYGLFHTAQKVYIVVMLITIVRSIMAKNFLSSVMSNMTPCKFQLFKYQWH